MPQSSHEAPTGPDRQTARFDTRRRGIACDRARPDPHLARHPDRARGPDRGRGAGRAAARRGRARGGRRHRGGRRGLPPGEALPRRGVGGARGARRGRRHLGPVPLPGHPLGLRHVHARLPVPALAWGVLHRHGGGDPRLRAGHGPRRGGDRADPLRPARRADGVELGRPPLDRHQPHRRTASCGTPPGSSTSRPATTPTRPGTSSTSPARRTSAARSCTRRRGPRGCRWPAGAWSSSAAAPLPSRCSRPWSTRASGT